MSANNYIDLEESGISNKGLKISQRLVPPQEKAYNLSFRNFKRKTLMKTKSYDLHDLKNIYLKLLIGGEELENKKKYYQILDEYKDKEILSFKFKKKIKKVLTNRKSE